LCAVPAAQRRRPWHFVAQRRLTRAALARQGRADASASAGGRTRVHPLLHPACSWLLFAAVAASPMPLLWREKREGFAALSLAASGHAAPAGMAPAGCLRGAAVRASLERTAPAACSLVPRPHAARPRASGSSRARARRAVAVARRRRRALTPPIHPARPSPPSFLRPTTRPPSSLHPGSLQPSHPHPHPSAAPLLAAVPSHAASCARSARRSLASPISLPRPCAVCSSAAPPARSLRRRTSRRGTPVVP
jgi:hypothetical protein